MQPEKDTILYVITKSQEHLKSLGIASPRLDAEILLSDLLGMERIKLYSNFDRKLTEEEKDFYRSRIKERASFKPIAYILGKKSFYKSEFQVDGRVLIPRPETEELVEWVLKDNADRLSDVLDLGTGSGCIGISLQLERPDWNLVLSDVSSSALEVAKANANFILGTEPTIIRSDLWKSFPEGKKFDLIVSNPPYIPIREKDSLMKDVREFEPSSALFLENEEIFFRELLEGAKEHLKENGKIYLEIHPNFSKNLQEISKDLHYKSCTIKQDFSNKDRMIRMEL